MYTKGGVKGTQAWDNLEFFFYLIKSLYALRKFSKKISLIFLRFSPEFRCSNIFAVTEHTRNQIFWWAIQKFFFSKCSIFGPIWWFPRRFLKILIIYSQNLHFNLVFLSIFRKLCWAHAETISSHAEHTWNRFHRTLSIRGTNFRACSASCKMWTVFTCSIHAQHTRNEFYCTLSIRGTNFIACWAYLEPISSHAEHARKCLKVEYLGRIEFDFQKSRVTGPWDHMVSVSAKKVKQKISCLCTFKKGIILQWNQLLVILEEASNNALSAMRGILLKTRGLSNTG